MRCPACGRNLASEAAFCNACGVKVGSPPGDATEPPTHGESQSDVTVTVPRADFVGRQAEMGELVAALEDAVSGRGRLVMLVGEPGIGKTRAAEELASIAGNRGAQVLWGRCYEGQGTPPYWPWVQPIRAYIQQTSAEQLRVHMRPGGSAIAEIIPEVRDRLPDLEPPPDLDPQEARFRLFHSVTAFLKSLAQARPLVFVLDDLQWADGSSLLLLEFVAREMAASNLLLVGTYRDIDVTRRHPLSQSLGTLIREQLFQSVELRGLNQQEVSQMAKATRGVSLESGVVQAVHERTEGNPLFVGEIVRLMEREGMDDAHGWEVRIPSGIRDVIGRRLDRLSEECNRVLTIASVIGREFDFALLATVTKEESEDRLLEALDEALDAHVVQEAPGGAERYQFSHALIQQTLLEELSASRKVRLHARIADALEELYGGFVERHAAELAYHYGEAQAVRGTAKLVRYSIVAGERALAAYAYEEAVAHFRQGLTAREDQAPSTGSGQAMDDETAAILHGLGRAQSAIAISLDQRQEAFDNLRRALDYYVDEEDVPNAIAVAGPGIIVAGISGLTRFITRALTVVSPDSHDAGRLLSRLGMALAQEMSDDAGAQEAFRKALVIAQREKDTALEAWILARGASVDWQNLRHEQSLERSLRAIELAGQVDEARAELLARSFAPQSLLVMGKLEGARVHAENFLALSERLRERTFMVTAFLSNQIVCQAEGDWSGGRDFSDRALALRGAPWALGDRMLLEYQVGDFRQGETYLRQLLDDRGRVPPGPNLESSLVAVLIPLVARISGNVDRLDVAEESARTVLASSNATPFVAMSARVSLALVAVQRGDAESAGFQYDALVSRRGTMLAACRRGFALAGSMVSADRVLGLLAHTMGQPEKIAFHFEEALAFCRKAGYRPELAWSLHDYAEALLQPAAAGLQPTSAAGHREKAASLLDEALSISTELGMRPLVERVTAFQVKFGLRRASHGYPDGLTLREVEVLRLIADGKSNAEIAEQLFISPHTVVRHVSNIFAKTGSSNRAEAASYATRRGLASQ